MKPLLLMVSLYICGIANAKNYYFSSGIGNDSRTSVQAKNPATRWITSSKTEMKSVSYTQTITLHPNTSEALLPPTNTYYISPTGSNTAAGTITAPWRTLAYAASSVTTAGSIIHILPGNYTETAACVLRAGVSIEGEGVTSHIISTFTGEAAISLKSNVDGTNGNQSISNLKLSGSNLTGRKGILVLARSNVKIFNCTIQDFLEDGVVFKAAVNGGQPSIYATGNELYNCIITNNSSRYTGQGNIVATGYRGMLIHDNILTQTGRPLGQNGNTFSATTDGYSEGLKFYNNKSYRNPDEGGDWSFHLELWDSQGGMEIYNNEFYGGNQQVDFGGNDLTKGTYAYGADVHHNLFQFDTPVQTSSGKQDIGVNIEGNCEYIIVRDNHFKNMPYGVQMTLGHTEIGQNQITIKNNLFENGGYENNEWGFDITVLGEGYPAGVGSYLTNLQIYNNTFITNSLSALFISMHSVDVVSNVSFVNNIVRGVRDYGYISFVAQSGSGGTKNNYTIKNNLLYQNANSNSYQLQNGAALPTNWTYTGNFVSNPLLDAEFLLQPGSPAINAGINVGLPYCGILPDAGMKEFCSGLGAPVANAGVNQTITLPVSNVTLSGTATTNSSIVSWVWRKLSGGSAVIGTQAQTTTASGLTAGVYTFELFVTDNAGLTDTDTMQVTVNLAPIANAGSDQNITVPVNAVSLNGSGSDPDGTISAYLWTKISGPTAGTITNTTSASSSATALVQGVYKFVLTVTDNRGAIARDTTTVNFATIIVPVKLLEFSASKKSGKTLLQWSTITEIDSKYFEVQRSNDGIIFETTGSIDAAGNSNTLISYQFTDNYPKKGYNYYRLKIVDKGGQFEYSKIVNVYFATDPATGSLEIKSGILKQTMLHLNVNSSRQQSVILGLYDETGRILFTSNVVLQKGSNYVIKPTVFLSAGIYYLKIKSDEEQVTIPILNGE